MRLLVPLLVMLAAFVPARSQCRSHECSNDVDGVLGDETLRWDASEGATWYEVRLESTGEVCAQVYDSTSDPVTYLVSGTPCDEVNDGSGFRVRACNDKGCSEWSEDCVEILPFSCLAARDWNPCHATDKTGQCIGGHDTQCERPCYEWQPGTGWRRLPGRYDECP